MSGGAINSACRLVREEFLYHVSEILGHDVDELHLRNGEVVATGGRTLGTIAELGNGHVFDHRAEFHHAKTEPLDDNGQGDAFVAFAFAAHRATVEVDPELGLTRIVDITTSQDVGRVLNPIQAWGQVEGGIAQGVGLALMEELKLDRGRPINASFADYLIPTTLDMPPITIAAFIEEPEPLAPLGAKGMGELPTVSSTPAIVAAIRAATGIPLRRVPVRPADIALGQRKATNERAR